MNAPPETAQKTDDGLEAERALEASLVRKYPSLSGKITIQRARRVWASVQLAEFDALFAHCVKELEFGWLPTITGTDEGEKLGVTYHLARDSGLLLSLTVLVPRDGPGPNTVTGIFPSADLYERELVDLLGVEVQGLPTGNRYPLPDNWPGGHPLRKDWQPAELHAANTASVEAKE